MLVWFSIIVYKFFWLFRNFLRSKNSQAFGILKNSNTHEWKRWTGGPMWPLNHLLWQGKVVSFACFYRLHLHIHSQSSELAFQWNRQPAELSAGNYDKFFWPVKNFCSSWEPQLIVFRYSCLLDVWLQRLYWLCDHVWIVLSRFLRIHFVSFYDYNRSQRTALHLIDA